MNDGEKQLGARESGKLNIDVFYDVFLEFSKNQELHDKLKSGITLGKEDIDELTSILESNFFMYLLLKNIYITAQSEYFGDLSEIKKTKMFGHIKDFVNKMNAYLLVNSFNVVYGREYKPSLKILLERILEPNSNNEVKKATIGVKDAVDKSLAA